jgi:hypothetical protein
LAGPLAEAFGPNSVTLFAHPFRTSAVYLR